MRRPRVSEARSLRGKRVVFLLAGELLGGAERGVLDLACDLRGEAGAVVEVCALDDRRGRARELADERDIPWTCIRTPWLGGPARKALGLARVARGLRRLRPDVVVSATNLPNVVASLTWRLTGAQTAVWCQCDVNGTTRISQGLFQRALRAAPIVVAKAEHAREWLAAEFGVDPARVHVIHQKVELPPARESRAAWRERLGLRESDLVACKLAHFHAGKDHATALRAWRLVVDALVPDGGRPVLLLAGRDAGHEAAVKAVAFDLDLREHVRFLGDVGDVRGLLDAADLAVFCSHRECLPGGVTEPMAAGLPVAGTDIPGIREAVGREGETLLAPAGDAPALAEAILRLARDAALRARIGEAGAELVRRRQSADVTSRLYAELLAEGLAGASPRRGSPRT